MRLAIAAIAVSGAAAWNNGLGAVPAMGWSSWNAFGCTSLMNETSIRAIVDLIVSSGLQAAGYEYVNLDDCIVQPTRNSQGQLVPDSTRFPSGIKVRVN